MANHVKDMTGLRFGKLTVIKKAPNSANSNKARWLCKCDCGNTTIVYGYLLRNGGVKSCGCLVKQPREDLTREKIGRLTIIEYAGRIDGINSWKCRCECGKEKIVKHKNLICGDVLSCGCLRNDRVKETCSTHGKSNDRIYRIWAGMRDRCFNPHNARYKDYGGRGITICKEWSEFTTFLEWALDNGYNTDLTIDRIDTNGNYEPSNCRWATIEEQANNKRNNITIAHNGEVHTAAEWSRITGIKRNSIVSRMKLGWETDKLFSPIKERGK